MLRRVTIALALVAGLAWSCLLFGIGLDDLMSGDTRPGVIFAITMLVILIGGLLYGLWRLVRPQLAKRFARR